MRSHLLCGFALCLSGASFAQVSAPAGPFADREDGATVDTHLGAQAVRPGDVSTFDVADLRLGMSVKEANRVAFRQGFRSDIGGHRNLSFEGRAWLIANNSLPTNQQADAFKMQAPEHSRALHSDGENLRINWLPTAAGARLHQLVYNSPNRGNERDKIVAQLISKYGKPSYQKDQKNGFNTYTMAWCSKADLRCWEQATLPMMRADVSDASFSLVIFGGSNAEDANAKAIDARAAQLRGRGASPVRF